MSYTTDVVVKGIEIDATEVRVNGYDSAKKGYSSVTLPAGMPTPAIGETIQLTFELVRQ